MGDITKNFSRHEFACNCGCNFDRVHPEFVQELQKGRNVFGTMVISSGNRCPEYNKEVGGATNSLHQYGIASDVGFVDIDWNDPEEVLKVLKFFDEKTNVFRIGLYSWGAHFDKFYKPEARYWWKDSEGYHYVGSVKEIVEGLFETKI